MWEAIITVIVVIYAISVIYYVSSRFIQRWKEKQNRWELIKLTVVTILVVGSVYWYYSSGGSAEDCSSYDARGCLD